eukprot:Nk52_evm66s2039 gene=Nk52_evmTU66s2039
MSRSVELHSFGQVNWYKEKQRFENEIKIIRDCLNSYLNWSETSVPTSKLLLLLKDRYQNVLPIKNANNVLNSSLFKLKAVDIDGQRRLSKHVREEGRITNVDMLKGEGKSGDETEKRHKALSTVDQLQAIAGELHLQCHTDIANEGAESVGSVFINDDMFYLEIFIGGDGNVKEVKVSHTFNEKEGGSPESSPILTKLLKVKQYISFKEHVRKLKKFYSIGRACTEHLSNETRGLLFKAIIQLENDLENIMKFELEQTGGSAVETIISKGHGAIYKREGGNFASLAFYVSPLAIARADIVLQKAAVGNMELLKMKKWLLFKFGSVADIELEEGPDGGTLMLCPTIGELLEETGVQFKPVSELREHVTGPFRFVLKLRERIPSCMSVVKLFPSDPKSIHCSQEEATASALRGQNSSAVNFSNMLQCEHLLMMKKMKEGALPKDVTSPQKLAASDCQGLVFSQNSGPKIASSSIVFGKKPSVPSSSRTHEYHMVIESSSINTSPGVYLERIPFCHPQELLPTLNVLRQQLTFNTLYSSLLPESGYFNSSGDKCQSKYFSVNSKAPKGDESPVFEVSSKAPSSIAITCRHPLSTNILCLEITIGRGGEISTDIHCAATDKLWCDENYFETLINTSLDIPLSLEHFVLAANAKTTSK